jgi:hypothetical protein
MKVILFNLLLLLLLSCDRIPVKLDEKSILFQEDSLNKTIIVDPNSKNHFFQRLNENYKYGIGYTYQLNDNDAKNGLTFVVKGKVRTNNIYSNGSIIIILSNNTEQTHWIPNNLKYHIVDLNSWNWFYDSINLPKSTKEYPYNKIFVQTALGDSKSENFDLDSLKFVIKK